MQQAKAQKQAETFKDDWEIDAKQQHGIHKPTGFDIDLGDCWHDEKGHLHYQSVFNFTKSRKEWSKYQDMEFGEVVNELQRQFGILYEAGYMPGMTDEEWEEENRKLDEEVAKLNQELHEQALEEERWEKEHPEEVQKMIEENMERFRREQEEEEIRWYLDRGIPLPDKYSGR